MSIRQIKNKSGTKYESRLRLGGASESRTFATLAEAKAWELQTKAKAGRGEYSPKSDTQSYSMTLHAALGKYIVEVTRGKKWPEVESNRAKRLQRHSFAKKRLISITAEDIFSYKNERLDAGKAANTIRLELVLLSQVFDTAALWQMPKLINPVTRVKNPKLPQPSNRRFEPSPSGNGPGELEQLCAALPADVAIMVRIAIETALRRSELCRVEWRDVDLNLGYLNNIVGKDGLIESIPLTAAAIQLFKSVARVEGSTLVFHRTPEYLTRRMYATCKKLGMKGLHFHVTRHEGTSKMFEKGLRIEQVQLVTRHKTMAMLNRYNHTRLQSVKAAIDAADKVVLKK